VKNKVQITEPIKDYFWLSSPFHCYQVGADSMRWAWGNPVHRDKQPSTLTLTPRVDLESPINLIFFGGGRKAENKQTQTD